VKIEFANGKSAQTQLGIWYFKTNNWIWIFKLKKSSNENNNIIFEEFLKSKVG
jgi:hypothetical protein